MPRSCVFCSLLNGEGTAVWLYRGDHASALLPLQSGRLAPGHTLVIPTDHVVGVQDASVEALRQVILLVQRVAQSLAASVDAPGVNVLNASGPHTGQSVDHLHFHVVPRWDGDGLDTWLQGRSSHPAADDWTRQLRTALHDSMSQN